MDRKQELEKVINDSRRELEAIEDGFRETRNRALAGRCFKYRNSYSMPKRDDDYWWTYGRVIGVKNHLPVFVTFQIEKYGTLSIEESNPGPVSIENTWKEINRDEFEEALDEFEATMEVTIEHLRADGYN